MILGRKKNLGNFSSWFGNNFLYLAMIFVILLNKFNYASPLHLPFQIHSLGPKAKHFSLQVITSVESKASSISEKALFISSQSFSKQHSSFFSLIPFISVGLNRRLYIISCIYLVNELLDSSRSQCITSTLANIYITSRSSYNPITI